MKNKMNGTCKPAILGMFLSGLTYPVLATGDFSLSIGAGLEAHDNAALTNTDEESDTKRLVNTDIGYKKTDGAVNIDLGYVAEYGDYQHNVQGDETSINGRTALKWHAAPRLLDAVLNHQISQQLTDRRGLDVASNREERSVISAGLDGFLHLSAVDSLVLSPRFVDVRFDESEGSDSQRASMAAMWEHKISSVSSLDLTANYDDVSFDEAENDYTSPGVMLTFRTALSRLSYQIGLGANRVNRDTGEDVNGSTVRAAVDYVGDEGQSWGASYVRQLTDTSIGLAGVELSLDNFQSDDSNFAEFDIIHVNKVDAYWRNRVSASSQFSVGAGYQKQDYEDTPQDQDVAYVNAGYQYTINSRWSAGVDGRIQRTKFLDDPQEEFDTTRVYLSAMYRPTRPLEIRFSIGQDKRDSDIAENSYTDKVVLVGVRYRIF